MSDQIRPEIKPCIDGGTQHRVRQADLQEAESSPDGGQVRCLDCGKVLDRGPRDLTFRGTVAP